MNRPQLLVLSTGVMLLTCLFPLTIAAQTDCEQGNSELNSAQPQGISPQEIIKKFAEKEAIFKDARNNYTYTQEVTVQEMDGDTVAGEFRETTDILYDDQGRRLEQVTYAPATRMRGPATQPWSIASRNATSTKARSVPTSRTVVKPASRVFRALRTPDSASWAPVRISNSA